MKKLALASPPVKVSQLPSTVGAAPAVFASSVESVRSLANSAAKSIGLGPLVTPSSWPPPITWPATTPLPFITWTWAPFWIRLPPTTRALPPGRAATSAAVSSLPTVKPPWLKSAFPPTATAPSASGLWVSSPSMNSPYLPATPRLKQVPSPGAADAVGTTRAARAREPPSATVAADMDVRMCRTPRVGAGRRDEPKL